LLQAYLFDQSQRNRVLNTLREELVESISTFSGTQSVSEDLQAAERTAGGIINLLDTIARGQTVNGINHSRLTQLWDQTVNREWLKNRFRAATPGSHEWIPTNMIPEVIQRAQATGDAEEGAKWVKVHHELRTDTSWVIFKPSYSQKEKQENGQLYIVMQGHPGALYVQEGTTLVPQTEKSGLWHDELRTHFRSNQTVSAVLTNLQAYFQQTVWQSGLPSNIYPSHRTSRGILIDMQNLSSQQRDQFNAMNAMFDRIKQTYG